MPDCLFNSSSIWGCFFFCIYTSCTMGVRCQCLRDHILKEVRNYHPGCWRLIHTPRCRDCKESIDHNTDGKVVFRIFLMHQLAFLQMLLSVKASGRDFWCVFFFLSKSDKRCCIQNYFKLIFSGHIHWTKSSTRLFPKYLQESQNGDTETLYLCEAFPEKTNNPHINSKHMYILDTWWFSCVTLLVLYHATFHAAYCTWLLLFILSLLSLLCFHLHPHLFASPCHGHLHI